MRKQILVLCFAIIALSAYSQDTTKVKTKYLIGINSSYSAFNSWRSTYQNPSTMYNIELELFKDSTLFTKLLRFSTDYFNKIDFIYNPEGSRESKYLSSLQWIQRGYTSKKQLIKFYLQLGSMLTKSNDHFEYGLIVGGGFHIGRFRNHGITLELNQVWNTGAYNYFNAQIGLHWNLQNFFR
ncbi:MAG: hypothetical protein ACOYOV_02875 [Bacteroidales bacterium]